MTSNRFDAFHELEQIFRQFFRTFRQDLNELIGDDLTGTEYSILHHLSKKSPQIVSELSQEFHVSVSHITHVADQLERKHLAFRKRSHLDKRVVEIHISDKGRECVSCVSEKKREYILDKFSKLSDEELKQLITLFQKLI
jgi:DNA-binding MarR family transcriptional regulator